MSSSKFFALRRCSVCHILAQAGSATNRIDRVHGPATGPDEGWQDPNPKALGERVLADFTATIDELYPAEAAPDGLTRDADAHRAFGMA